MNHKVIKRTSDPLSTLPPVKTIVSNRSIDSKYTYDIPVVILNHKQFVNNTNKSVSNIIVFTDLTDILAPTSAGYGQLPPSMAFLKYKLGESKQFSIANTKLFSTSVSEEQYGDYQSQCAFMKEKPPYYLARVSIDIRARLNAYLDGYLNLIQVINKDNVDEIIEEIEPEFILLIKRLKQQSSNEVYKSLIKWYNLERFEIKKQNRNEYDLETQQSLIKLNPDDLLFTNMNDDMDESEIENELAQVEKTRETDSESDLSDSPSQSAPSFDMIFSQPMSQYITPQLQSITLEKLKQLPDMELINKHFLISVEIVGVEPAIPIRIVKNQLHFVPFHLCLSDENGLDIFVKVKGDRVLNFFQTKSRSISNFNYFQSKLNKLHANFETVDVKIEFSNNQWRILSTINELV